MPLSLGNIILLKEKGGMRESFPRQVDKESRGLQGEGSGILKEEGRPNLFIFFSSVFLSKDYITAMYHA